MSRRDDDYAWLVSLAIAIIGAFLALALFIASHACRVVHGAYARRGSSSHLLRLLAAGATGAAVLAMGLGLGLGAWGLAGLVAGSATLLVVTACWLLTAVWDTQER